MRYFTLACALCVLACSSASNPSSSSASTRSSNISTRSGQATVAQIYGGAEPNVRVELKSIGAWDKIALQAKGGFTVTEASGAARKAESITLTRNPDASPVRYKPSEGVFTLGKRTYSGTLVVEEGRLVNHVPLENYVLGVLRGELPLPKVPKDAAAAQAIAVRSYTLHYLLQDSPVRDVNDTTMYQVYAGLRYAPADAALRAGVNETRGRYLVWKNAPVKAYYHSTCGGSTTDVPTGLNRESVGCMTGVECDYCTISKYYKWELTLPAEFIRSKLGMKGGVQKFDVTKRGPGNRAAEVQIVTEGGKQDVHGGELRLRLGGSRVRSTRWSTVTLDGTNLILKGNGWGHGVGLCQMGAIGRARSGMKGDAIVLTYYAGAKIERAY